MKNTYVSPSMELYRINNEVILSGCGATGEIDPWKAKRNNFTFDDEKEDF